MVSLSSSIGSALLLSQTSPGEICNSNIKVGMKAVQMQRHVCKKRKRKNRARIKHDMQQWTGQN